MRLIDADEFITNLKDYIDKPMTAGLCATLVESVPTAYDIGKVVDELEKLKDKGSVTKTGRLITRACVDRAIEIVKQGGVRKDVSK